MSKPQLVIFDCDGVLVDSELIACRVDSECFAEVGVTMSAAEIADRYIGIGAMTMLAEIEERHGVRLPADFTETLRARVASAFDAELSAMPGVAEALGELKIPRCVASSSAPPRLRHSLGLTGLLEQFDPHIFSATQVERGKPAPDLFLFAAAQMGVPPEACLVIEDSLAGVQAGVAAGMRVAGFTGGGHCGPEHAAKLRAAGAHVTFGHMRELAGLLGD